MRCSYHGTFCIHHGAKDFFSSAQEYVGSSMGSQPPAIPYHTVLVCPQKPHNSGQNVMATNVLCDTEASVSLAPVSIKDSLGIKYDPNEGITVHGADGGSIEVLGTA